MNELPIASQHGPLLMPHEAAAILGLSAAVIEGLAGKGIVPRCIRIGHKVRFRRSEIEALLAAHQ